ncbi:glycosyltransferase family 4 protein [Rhodoblastus sp.]|uniref:glycosyltransferase family 4 protein n=1 Tax=Rhodoblastus sp. TaxID=1962975 RepID=UPI003F9AC2C4
MRILTVTHFYENHGGGIERVAAQLNREFANCGHDPLWAASDFDSPPGARIAAAPLRCYNPIEKFTGLPMPIPSPRGILALWRAVRVSDAVIIHDSLYITSIFAAVLAKLNRKPLLLIQHISQISFASYAMRSVMRLANFIVTRPMLGAADILVFISDVVRRDLIGEPAWRPYRLLQNGIDGALFHPRLEKSRSRVRRDYGIPVDRSVAIFVGRFVEKKGLSILAALAHRRPDLHFALVGNGPVRPGKWGLPNIHVLGFQSQATLADLYRASDFLLLPSVGEGYPLVIQEAMACGLPVICGAASALADPSASRWLQGVEIDLSDRDGSAARCGNAIDKILRNPVDIDGMAAYAARSYSWRVMAEALVDDLSKRVEALSRNMATEA